MLVLLAAAAVAGCGLPLGLDAWHVVTLGACVAVVGLVAVEAPRAAPVQWPAGQAPERGGSRPDLLYLSVSLRSRSGGGGVGQAGLTRVQALGRERLRRRGLRLDRAEDRAEAERLVGPEALRVLLANAAAAPDLRAVQRCLQQLELLGGPAGTRSSEGPWTRTP